MLSSKVNSRDPVIVTDAELSIVKVAQLERVFYYKGAEPTVQSLLSERSAAGCQIQSPRWVVIIGCLLLCVLLYAQSHDGTKIVHGNAKYHRVTRENRQYTFTIDSKTCVLKVHTCMKHMSQSQYGLR